MEPALVDVRDSLSKKKKRLALLSQLTNQAYRPGKVVRSYLILSPKSAECEVNLAYVFIT